MYTLQYSESLIESLFMTSNNSPDMCLQNSLMEVFSNCRLNYHCCLLTVGINTVAVFKKSVITPVTDTTISQLQIPEEQMKSGNETVTVTVTNVHTIEKVERFIACFNCAKRILQGNSRNVVHCDWCKHPMRISNCSQYVCAKLVLHVNGQQIYFTAFQDMLSNVIKGDFARFSEVEIAEMLLL